MPEHLEKAAEKTPVRPGDIVIVNTGWHHYYSDSRQYYAYSPGFYKEAGEWFAEKQVKLIGTDTQALDHPLGMSGARLALTAEYRFQHISNANIAPHNLGINAHGPMVGCSWLF